MKKIIAFLLAFLLLLSAVMFFVVKTMPYFSPSRLSEGDLLFADADNVTEIILKTDAKKIKLRKIDGSWLVNGYYARNLPLDDYLQKLQTTVIVRPVENQAEAGVQMQLKTNGRDVFFGRVAAAENERQSVVDINAKNYLVSENLLLPMDLSAYYRQPLLPLENRQIEQMIGLPATATDILRKLPCLGAKHKLPEKMLGSEHRNFVIVTDDGLKIIGGLFADQEKYLLSISLKTTIMPTEAAEEYVKQNGFRYEGWYFILSRHDGNRLLESLKTN